MARRRRSASGRRGARRWRALGIAALLGAGLLCALPSRPARAHRGSTKSFLVEVTETGARLTLELELPDVAVSIGMDEDAARASVMERRADIDAWLLEGLSVRGEGGTCALEVTELDAVDRDAAERVIAELVASCPEPVRELSLLDSTIFADDAQHEAFVRGRFSDATDTQVLRRGRQEARLGEPPSVPALLWRFAREGVVHLVTGYDHLLFLLSLILSAGGLAARESLKVALRDVATVVTAFTIGHSVTLIAAALGWVVLPARLVESVIALSIALVAAINIVRPQARRGMAPIALVFGLVHGFGFSGVLADLGLPGTARVLSLVAFNVGIEVAQLAFVAVLLWPLAKLGEARGYERWVVRGGSAFIALIALFWVFERAFG